MQRAVALRTRLPIASNGVRLVHGEADGLPPLEDAEIALLKARGGAPRAADRLAEFILASLDRRAGRPAA